MNKTTLRNVQEKPKTPTEKKESIMLKEAKARYLIRSILLYDIPLLLPTPLNNFTVDFFCFSRPDLEPRLVYRGTRDEVRNYGRS